MGLFDEGGGEFMPPSTQPRAVHGGIRMQSRRGASSWWSRRWLAALEAGAVGERHAQSLEDARRGRVLELEVELGQVRAAVQGTRREPHVVTIRLAAIEQLTWLRIAEALAARGGSRAELLARQMPDTVDAVFRREDVSLFPLLDDDLDISCTCEDWSTPCRHALAAGMLVAEAMDADPLLAFKARGIEPALLMAVVAGGGAGVGAAARAGADVADTEPDRDDRNETRAEREKCDLHPAAAHIIALDSPPIDAPLVRILGAPPMWRGADSFEPAMRRLYARVASDPRTIELALRTGPGSP